MAQILAPTSQWQMRITKSSIPSSPMTGKMWTSLVLKQNKKGAIKSSAKFRVFASKYEDYTINRLEGLLNLDLTPYTDKIIAEYIWYISSSLLTSDTINKFLNSFSLDWNWIPIWKFAKLGTHFLISWISW